MASNETKSAATLNFDFIHEAKLLSYLELSREGEEVVSIKGGEILKPIPQAKAHKLVLKSPPSPLCKKRVASQVESATTNPNKKPKPAPAPVNPSIPTKPATPIPPTLLLLHPSTRKEVSSLRMTLSILESQKATRDSEKALRLEARKAAAEEQAKEYIIFAKKRIELLERENKWFGMMNQCIMCKSWLDNYTYDDDKFKAELERLERNKQAKFSCCIFGDVS